MTILAAFPTPEPAPEQPAPTQPDPDAPFVEATERLLGTKTPPDYWRTEAEGWLARRSS